MLNGLWEIPNKHVNNINHMKEELKNYINGEYGFDIKLGKQLGTISHSYSHFKMKLILLECKKIGRIKKYNQTYSWIKKSEISNYTVGPIFMSDKTKGSHEWIIEFSKEPDDMNKFTEILDLSLQSLNSDYEAKRYKDSTLELPKIIKGRKNLFYDWLRSRNKLGGQNKIPRLSNSREYVEELLGIN